MKKEEIDVMLLMLEDDPYGTMAFAIQKLDLKCTNVIFSIIKKELEDRLIDLEN